jgi:Fur family transcriptional regulator, ferric uptake regulator
MIMPGGPPWYHGKIRGFGYRLTFPRQKILEILSKSSGHLSAEDIYHKAHKAHPGLGLTTVYRTLELLVNARLVFKFDFGDGKSRYELARGPGAESHHHHLICNGCQRVINYSEIADKEKKMLKDAKKDLSRKYKFDIYSHQVHFYGLCQNCKNT